MPVQFLGWEDPLEEEIATQSSILTWEIPWTEEPGAIVHSVAKSQTQQSTCARTHTLSPQNMQPVLTQSSTWDVLLGP